MKPIPLTETQMAELFRIRVENETIRSRLAEIEAQEPVYQFRKEWCSGWYDGKPDLSDGGGPYQTRTLYLSPVVSYDVEKLKTELEAARKDAERYRWLRLTGDSEIYLHNHPGVDNCAQLGCECLDAIIDAAIEQAKGGV